MTSKDEIFQGAPVKAVLAALHTGLQVTFFDRPANITYLPKQSAS